MKQAPEPHLELRCMLPLRDDFAKLARNAKGIPYRPLGFILRITSRWHYYFGVNGRGSLWCLCCRAVHSGLVQPRQSWFRLHCATTSSGESVSLPCSRSCSRAVQRRFAFAIFCESEFFCTTISSKETEAKPAIQSEESNPSLTA